MPQFPINILGQSFNNKRAKTAFNLPDTDSRLIKITNGATTVAPNLMHDHTRFEYIVPTGNAQPVTFNAPINVEPRSLHILTLDNSNGGIHKNFTFAPTYVFLDDVGNEANSYNVPPGQKYIWFGAWVQGKMYFRDALESNR